MSECTICGSEEYNERERVCPDCGDYDESLHHGTEARERRQAEERADRERRRLRRVGHL